MADTNKRTQLNGNKIFGTGQNIGPPFSGGRVFVIHVKGQLNSRWSEWLEGLEVKYVENGEMILFGPIVDQAALMGVLNKLGRLNLTLLSVNEVKEINDRKKK